MVADLDEVEAAAAREGGDLGERWFGVAALARVDVEVAGVPARAAAEAGEGLVGGAFGLRGEGAGVAQDHGEGVAGGGVDELRLADDDAPLAGGDGTGEVAARGGGEADDRGLAVAAAPAAKAGGIVEAPVEDVVVGEVIVLDLDLDGAGRDVEGDEEVIEGVVRDRAVEDELGLAGERGGGEE